MSKRRIKILILFAAAALAMLCITFTGGSRAYAEDYAYSYEVKSYSVTMDVSADRTIEVNEQLTVYFTGYNSHGIIRDLPLDNGIKYKNIEATCSSSDFSPYTQDDDSYYLSLYLRGNSNVYGQTRTYTISYTMIVPALSQEGYLPLDVIGYGWDGLSNVTATVNVPDGLNDFAVYSGPSGTTSNGYAEYTMSGNTITITADKLYAYNGITLDLQFDDGVLSTTFDFTILWVLLLGIALVVITVIIKLTICREPDMTVTVNLEAPDEMDPVLMGKYIDNSVDSEDLGAAIFYLADKGYLTIDMSQDEKDPTLIKTAKNPTSKEPEHIRIIHEGLFFGRESVTVSQLKNTFFQTADRAKASVNAQTKGKFYNKTLAVCAVITGIICCLAFVLFHMVYTRINLFSTYSYMAGAAACGIAFVINAIAGAIVKQRLYKWKKFKIVGIVAATLIIGVGLSLLFMLFPCPAYGRPTTVISGAFASILGVMCGMMYTRTDDYTKKLGHILGFKQFILFTERDKIEYMLKDHPELYYHILPYAQVLGVTDAWTEKFKGLSMQPPRYVRYNAVDFAFDCLVWHTVFHTLNAGMAHNMVSRPSRGPSGGGHGIGGGFGGGFGGGGFGGGGGRGC